MVRSPQLTLLEDGRRNLPEFLTFPSVQFALILPSLRVMLQDRQNFEDDSDRLVPLPDRYSQYTAPLDEWDTAGELGDG